MERDLQRRLQEKGQLERLRQEEEERVAELQKRKREKEKVDAR